MTDYDPLIQPLELPVQTLRLNCISEAPLYFAPHEGSTPGTTLFGAFGVALWQTACARVQNAFSPCGGNPPECAAPFACPVPWLYKPYSKILRRNMARPVLLSAPALEQLEAVSEFELQVTLWGRHAIASLDPILATLQTMAERGLGPAGHRVALKIVGIAQSDTATLAQRAKKLNSRPLQHALLIFETPFQNREQVALENGRVVKMTQASGALPLQKILGNVAYELTAWDIEDRELGAMIDQKQRHELAREARRAVEAAAERVEVINSALQPARVGRRSAKTDGQTYFLGGFIGNAEIAGDLNAVLPWLLALSLGGGGQKRSMGFGCVKLWFDA